MHPQQKILQHKINKKLMPGLVASYDLQPGNGTGLFLRKKISKEERSKYGSKQANNLYTARIDK